MKRSANHLPIHCVQLSCCCCSTDIKRYSLAEQSESPQAVQELSTAALVEVKSWQGGRRLLQFENQKGPTFLLHCDGAKVTGAEAERPPAPLVAVVQGAWEWNKHKTTDLTQSRTGGRFLPLLELTDERCWCVEACSETCLLGFSNGSNTFISYISNRSLEHLLLRFISEHEVTLSKWWNKRKIKWRNVIKY